MGNGVNIAARLEGVAKLGAVCLSEDAYRQVKQRLDLKVSDLGPTQLKNPANGQSLSPMLDVVVDRNAGHYRDCANIRRAARLASCPSHSARKWRDQPRLPEAKRWSAASTSVTICFLAGCHAVSGDSRFSARQLGWIPKGPGQWREYDDLVSMPNNGTRWRVDRSCRHTVAAHFASPWRRTRFMNGI